MTIIFISLLSILIIYFIIALLPWKLCAICTAVSLTWFSILIMHIFGLYIDMIWLGIMMGGSVIGLMYKLDEYLRKNNYSGVWLLKLAIVIFGFLFTYLIINQKWQLLLWLLPIGVIVGAIGFILLHKKSNQHNLSSGLQDKLDNCCD